MSNRKNKHFIENVKANRKVTALSLALSSNPSPKLQFQSKKYFKVTLRNKFCEFSQNLLTTKS
jgi:hypothetical protein